MAEEMQTKQVNVEVPAELWDRFSRKIENRGWRLKRAVTGLLRYYLMANREAHDRLYDDALDLSFLAERESQEVEAFDRDLDDVFPGAPSEHKAKPSQSDEARGKSAG